MTSITAVSATANAVSHTRLPLADAMQSDAPAFHDSLAQAQAGGPDDATPVTPGASATTSKGSAEHADDEDKAPCGEATAPAAPAMPAMAPAFASNGIARAAHAHAAQARAGAVGAADAALAGRSLSGPELASDGKVALFDTLLDQIKPGVESASALAATASALEAGRFAPLAAPPQQAAAVAVGVGQRGWDQGLGEQLLWMTSQKHQVAELRLNPPELGPLKITITLDQNQASAQFVSAHAAVREAIESALPRLREMLSESGISLGNTSVGAETFGAPAQQQSGMPALQARATVLDPAALASGERRWQRSLGLVDTFA
jgi:flagellar hook-length control protein FliK